MKSTLDSEASQKQVAGGSGPFWPSLAGFDLDCPGSGSLLEKGSREFISIGSFPECAREYPYPTIDEKSSEGKGCFHAILLKFKLYFSSLK